MFTEYELDTMIGFPEIKEANFELKKNFIKTEAPYLEISDHDFFSLVMMTPTLGIALADGKVSLFEELALNKKARKLSTGGYFLKKDPVVYAMKFLLKNYDTWSDKFMAVLKLAIETTFHHDGVAKKDFDEEEQVDYDEYKKEVLQTPFILIRFIASFFLENDEEIISNVRHCQKSEYRRMLEIGKQLGLTEIRVFQMFCRTFEVK
ncbi:MAG: hypothetical protein R8G66_01080 [Cytophagales bacterium]|nr:hypothetical protein [Cytophagales bacterium]